MGYVLALASAFFFALSNICFRRGLKDREGKDKQVGLFISILVNNIINFFVLALLLAFKTLPPVDGRSAGLFVAAGIFASFLGRFLLFSSIERIGAARAASLKITAPIFALFMGAVFLREIPSLPSLLGMGVVLSGVYFVSRETHKNLGSKEPLEYERIPANYLRFGVLIGILAGLSFGAGNVLRKMGVLNYAEPLVGVALGSFAALLFVTVLLIKEKKVPTVSSLIQKEFLSSFIPGGLLTSIALYAFFYALKSIPVAIANSIESTEPMFIFLISYLFLQKEEVITPAIVLSSAAIMAGVVMIILF